MSEASSLRQHRESVDVQDALHHGDEPTKPHRRVIHGTRERSRSHSSPALIEGGQDGPEDLIRGHGTPGQLLLLLEDRRLEEVSQSMPSPGLAAELDPVAGLPSSVHVEEELRLLRLLRLGAGRSSDGARGDGDRFLPPGRHVDRDFDPAFRKCVRRGSGPRSGSPSPGE